MLRRVSSIAVRGMSMRWREKGRVLLLDIRASGSFWKGVRITRRAQGRRAVLVEKLLRI